MKKIAACGVKSLVFDCYRSNESKSTTALDDALRGVDRIEWSVDGEPDIIKAIVFNQLFVDDCDTALAVLDKLLPFVLECNLDRMYALLKRQSDPVRLQKCVDRHNQLDEERQVQLITKLEDLDPKLRNETVSLPLYVVSVQHLVQSTEKLDVDHK